jgi:hypothetical protein
MRHRDQGTEVSASPSTLPPGRPRRGYRTIITTSQGRIHLRFDTAVAAATRSTRSTPRPRATAGFRGGAHGALCRVDRPPSRLSGSADVITIPIPFGVARSADHGAGRRGRRFSIVHAGGAAQGDSGPQERRQPGGPAAQGMPRNWQSRSPSGPAKTRSTVLGHLQRGRPPPSTACWRSGSAPEPSVRSPPETSAVASSTTRRTSRDALSRTSSGSRSWCRSTAE